MSSIIKLVGENEDSARRLLLDGVNSKRQFNRKADEGSHNPDRNAQFEHINAKVIAAQAKGQPVISVDTKKKERIGNFKNGGTDYCPKGTPDGMSASTSRVTFTVEPTSPARWASFRHRTRKRFAYRWCSASTRHH